MKIEKVIKFIIKKNNSLVLRIMQQFPKLFSDRFFLERKFKYIMDRSLNLDIPKTFNEKIQWLKLYYHNPILTSLVDKVEVKDYVAKKIGDKYIIPTLGVWDSFDKIDFDKLANQFVLKTNHDFGGIIICKEKENFDYQSAKLKLSAHLKRNFYSMEREWAYKNVKPRILAEEYLGILGDDDVKDYKFYCFNGEPKILLVSSGRQNKTEEMKWNFYDVEFNLLRFTKSNKSNDYSVEKPKNFELMLELSKALSENFPFVRTDFYNISGEIYFGELTFYPGAGYGKFEPEEWDYKLGSYLSLPNKLI